MKVRDVMTSPAITISPDAPFADAVDVLLRNGISGMPVVEDGGRLVGMVTEADLVSKEAYRGHGSRALDLVLDYLRGNDPQWVRRASGRAVRDVMTGGVLTAAPGDDLERVARRMLEAGRKRLPVVEDGVVVGVVSRHDLLKPFHRSDDAIAAEVERILRSPLCAPEGHECEFTVRDGVVTRTGTARTPSDVHVLARVVDGVPGVIAVENELTPTGSDPRTGVP